MATPFDPEQLRRWRLVLGKDSQESLDGMSAQVCSLSAADAEMDDALAAIYDETASEGDGTGQRSAGLGKSSPRLAKWLGDIRNYFKEDVVAVIQQDAIERARPQAASLRAGDAQATSSPTFSWSAR